MKAVFGGFAALSMILIGVVLLVVIIAGAAFSSIDPNLGDNDDKNQDLISCTPGAGLNQVPAEYRQWLIDAAAVAELPVEMAAAQIEIESAGWNPNAESHRGAQGLGQFMPETWAEFGEGDPFDPQANLKAYGKYMKWVRDYVKGLNLDANLDDLTFAGYNAGIGNVEKYGGVPPFHETQNYVRKIRNLAQTKYSGACEQIDRDFSPKSGEWSHPLPNSQMTSGYGPRPCPSSNCTPDAMNHQGVDFSTPGAGTSMVLAPTDMKITHAGRNGPWSYDWGLYYGTWILASQIGGEGYVFEFHHCQTDSLKVKAGDVVKPGQQLCREGNTGNSAGNHLHFQMGKPGTDPTNPTRLKTLAPKPILIEHGVL